MGGIGMNAEIIIIGSEILLGQIVDTNSVYLSKKFAQAGINVYHHQTIGDNPKRMRAVLEDAAKRADIIILAGGLGPTKDDITKNILADYLGKDLVIHEETKNKMLANWKNSAVSMPESNKRMYYIIEDAHLLKNDTGTALGSVSEQDGKYFVTLPGPPRELQPMVNRYLIPYLLDQSQEEAALYYETWRFMGITEPETAERLDHLIEEQSNPTLAVYAEEGESIVRSTASAATEKEAKKLVAQMKKKVMKEVGEFYFAQGDVTLPEVVMDLLEEERLTFASIEGHTGGKIYERLSDYDNGLLKGNLIYQSHTTLSRFLQNPLTHEMNSELAEHAKGLFDADWVLLTSLHAKELDKEEREKSVRWLRGSLSDTTEFIQIALMDEENRFYSSYYPIASGYYRGYSMDDLILNDIRQVLLDKKK